MISKNKIILITSLIYWGLIIGSTITLIIPELSEFKQELVKYTPSTIESCVSFVFYILILFPFFLCISVFKYYIFTIIYFGEIIAVKKFYKEKLDITDKKTDTYYRDLLTKYSVGVLGYIRNFNISERDLAATILNLELKGKISINNRIEIKNDTLEGLETNEIYVLKNLISNNGKTLNLHAFELEVRDDCLNHKLLTDENDFKRKRKSKKIRFICLMIFLILNLTIFPGFFNKYITGKFPILETVFIILYFASFFMIIIAPMVFIFRLKTYDVMDKLNPYIRNKEARELNNKLNGLENFLKDFSIIHERESKHLKVWREYLIYSVIFGQNDDIKDEIIAKLK